MVNQAFRIKFAYRSKKEEEEKEEEEMEEEEKEEEENTRDRSVPDGSDNHINHYKFTLLETQNQPLLRQTSEKG